MKKCAHSSRHSLLAVVIVFFGILPVISVLAQDMTFTRTLKLGMSGDDVMQLQKLLNSDPETQVSLSGPGSPGRETNYFGTNTAAAVSRLQEKYAAQILTPEGLTQGTGIFGPLTRRMIAQTAMHGQQNPIPASAGPVTSSQSNPNLTNRDKFIADETALAAQRGYSAATIETIRKQIVADTSTSTDLMKAFTDLVKKNNQTSAIRPNSTFISSLLNAWQSFAESFVPRAAAQTGGQTAFGGQLYYSYFCSCTGNWLVEIQALPPSYVTMLTYYEGSQAYLSYNIPFTTELLGNYTAGGQCQVYAGEDCVELPQEGEISSTVGSSL
ncbi:MAG: peptidoglycan-binding protein [Patescibacteria group bacterium]|nr:peptidoglycan-binding protein [Patescibacteria group bacterium]MDE2172858.1 peptidoglycan-binding protein [Patescibacteria group bacterium]